MYKIIGADGKEYGPVSAEQLRQWQTEGRVNAQTKVQVEGSTDWKTLEEAFAASPSSTTAGVPLIAPLTQTSFKPIGGDTDEAARKVKGPAIFIIVISILNIIATFFSFFWLANQEKVMQMLGLPASGEREMELQQKINTMFSVPAIIIGGILAVICLFGAFKMMKLQSHKLAIAVAIMMLIPCGNCCCLLNLGAGIWALTVLQKPEVKAAFE